MEDVNVQVDNCKQAFQVDICDYELVLTKNSDRRLNVDEKRLAFRSTLPHPLRHRCGTG
jgi:hypothetical protein